MIKAMIFDLGGTLVQTEKLKALSYAKAAVALCPYDLDEEEVIEAFKEVVGRSPQEVAVILVGRFQLDEKARARSASRPDYSQIRREARYLTSGQKPYLLPRPDAEQTIGNKHKTIKLDTL
jgi:phosphoglycolate phosphatase-like HAD superfamily hydrolase